MIRSWVPLHKRPNVTSEVTFGRFVQLGREEPVGLAHQAGRKQAFAPILELSGATQNITLPSYFTLSAAL